MDRRNFLAIIPSLSAIPFIGKDIVLKSDRIEIFQPEQMEQEVSLFASYFDIAKTEVHLVCNNKTIAKGYLTTLNMDNPILYESSFGHNPYKEPMNGRLSGHQSITIEGSIYQLL